ncbi:MAG: hypothetical protein MUE73_04530 [Planctomycetes bacterium]|jgi:hypothetical protein|nr:hypothetical protein [Planctomycetota bacterium]
MDAYSPYNPNKAVRMELDAKGIKSAAEFAKWLAAGGSLRACACCLEIFETPVPHNGICERCKDHQVCAWCAQPFVPGGNSKGRICGDPWCRASYAEHETEVQKARSDKARAALAEKVFFKTCPLVKKA